MMLYHGTSARHLTRILEVGIQPRALSKHRGNWSHTVPSNSNAVYLTDAYPMHFAVQAGRSDTGLIFEIDREKLLPWKLCPDEDAIEQSTRSTQIKGGPPLDWSMKKRTIAYRKLCRYNPDLADASLKAMGTAGYYGTVPVDAITRYVKVDWTEMELNMYLFAADTSVSVLNYKILQDRHRAYVKWLFGDPVTVDELLGTIFDQIEGEIGEMERKRRAYYTEQLKNRSAMTVVSRSVKADAA